MTKTISFTLNGAVRKVTIDDERMLLWVLRDDLEMSGTKYGCGKALCGSCTVLVNDQAVRACSTKATFADGKRVITIEGLATGDHLHPIQAAFVKHAGFQCGFCTPGMILGAHALLAKNPRPTREQIMEGMDRHLCRCGAHLRIVDAIEEAAAVMAGAAK